MQKHLLLILAIIGAVFGLFIAVWSQKAAPIPPVTFAPSSSPYDYPIAGTGIIESHNENISVGSPYTGIISKVFVKKGDFVNQGDPLFSIDSRELYASKELAQATYNLATVTYEKTVEQFGFYERLSDKKSVSEQAYQSAFYAMMEAKENLSIAAANLKLIEVNIDRSVVKAPITGQVLQVNCHVGEIAPAIPVSSSQSTWRAAANGGLVLLGDVSRFHVRIDIDADDAWRYTKGAKAMGYVRGNKELKIPLSYSYIEPYVIPKSSFTGQVNERVDTRVLQVIYEFEKNHIPIYPGQIVDVYIDVKPSV